MAPSAATAFYETLSFQSLDETAVGHLYLPHRQQAPPSQSSALSNLKGSGTNAGDSSPSPTAAVAATGYPAVISAAGFGGVKEMMLPDFCRAFAAAGIACFIFDFIGFGASGGALRQEVAPQQQLATFRDALSFLAKDPRIDPARIGVWGPSLSGGHALSLAGTDGRLRAAVAIIPHVSVLGAAPTRVDLAFAIAKDALGRLLSGGKKHKTIPAAGEEGELAVMNTDGALCWILEKSAGCETFRNEVTVSSIPNMLRYNTAPAAAKIKVPLLAITARDDKITPAKNIHGALKGVKTAEFKDYPGTHFGLFGEYYEEVIDLTVAFMVKHL